MTVTIRCRSEQIGELGHLGTATDERGECAGRLCAGGAAGARPREVPVQAGRDHLEESFVVVEAAQPVRAEIEQVDAGQTVTAGQAVRSGAARTTIRTGRARPQVRTAWAVAPEQRICPPCAAAATRAARCTSRLAYSPRRAGPTRCACPSGPAAWRRFRPLVCGQSPLRLHTRRKGRRRIPESREERVTLGEEFDATEVTQRSPNTDRWAPRSA